MKSKKNTKIGENTSRIRLQTKSYPLYALLFFVIGLLITVAKWDYNPSQNPWITTLAESGGSQTFNLVGTIGVATAFWSNYTLGLASWLLAAYFFLTSYLFSSKTERISKLRVFSIIFALLSLTGLLNIFDYYEVLQKDPNYYPFGSGGIIGEFIFQGLFHKSIGIFGSSLILGSIFLPSFLYSFRAFGLIKRGFIAFKEKAIPMIKELPYYISQFARYLKEKISSMIPERTEYEAEELTIETPTKKQPKKEKPKKALAVEEAPKKLEKKEETKETPCLKIIEEEVIEKATFTVPQRKGDYAFPGYEILSEAAERHAMTEEEHAEVVENLVKTLSDFGVSVTPGEVHAGPVITRYEVTPAPGVRVEKIANLDKNIALALKAHSVRILAPVPGKGSVGIEIPNKTPSAVCLREIIESTAWSDCKAEIPIVLGKEVTGKPLVFDLTKMPHLLIAGSTGSGKTVCINTIIASLLYHASPEDLRFIMIDPKIVEMQLYNSLPHMLIPVVTDPKKVPAALKWLIAEMEHRYQVFAKAGARNIASFNAKILKDKKERQVAEEMEADLSPEERAALRDVESERNSQVELPTEKMPYIVCVVDELADLMMVAPADIETCIARLAQLARAAGIHLILATQRPSVNVITGVIKANLPCRIAFKVASKVDSRTIIDGGGADQLIGRGDMLFIPPGSSSLVRAQGAFVADEEINNIIDELKVNGPPEFAYEVQRQIDAEGGDEGTQNAYGGDWDDELVPAALDVIRSSKRASTSMLQRRLKIGYNRAARIMELLEAEGFVGPDNGSSPREILKDLDVLV